MKILHITASVDERNGGVADAVLRLTETCAEEHLTDGDEIVCLDQPDAFIGRRFPICVHALGETPRRRNVTGRALDHYGYSKALIPWLKDNVGRFDVVIQHGLWNYSAFGARRALIDAAIPYYVYAHGMLDPWFKRAYPRKHMLKQAFWLLSEGPLLANATAVLFTCAEEEQQARGAFWGYQYKAQVAPLGATEPPPKSTAQNTAFAAACPELAGRRFLLFLGRIHPKKGCDLLVQAYAEVVARDPSLDLVFVGPDNDGWVAQLKELALNLGVGDRIHWPGALFGDAKWGAFYNAAAFVLPSHQENFGIAVAEAMACEVPVLITNKVNIHTEISQAKAGLVCEDNLGGIRDQLEDWTKLTDADRYELGKRGGALYRSSYRLPEASLNLIKLIQGGVRQLKA